MKIPALLNNSEGINQDEVLAEITLKEQGQSIDKKMGIGKKGLNNEAMLKTQKRQQQIWGVNLPPRERLLRYGAATLSDSELLAIFLRVGMRNINVMQLADQLITNFGSLQGLLAADYQDFIQQPGLGIAKYSQLQAAVELSRRFLARQLCEGKPLDNPKSTHNYLISRLGHREREVFVVMFLDNQHRVIAVEELFMGTFNAVEVHPREIIREALRYNAAALILAHNHPSGRLDPSKADRDITRAIQEISQQLEIRVLDHIIIGGSSYFSFAEQGWMG